MENKDQNVGESPKVMRLSNTAAEAAAAAKSRQSCQQH